MNRRRKASDETAEDEAGKTRDSLARFAAAIVAAATGRKGSWVGSGGGMARGRGTRSSCQPRVMDTSLWEPRANAETDVDAFSLSLSLYLPLSPSISLSLSLPLSLSLSLSLSLLLARYQATPVFLRSPSSRALQLCCQCTTRLYCFLEGHRQFSFDCALPVEIIKYLLARQIASICPMPWYLFDARYSQLFLPYGINYLKLRSLCELLNFFCRPEFIYPIFYSPLLQPCTFYIIILNGMYAVNFKCVCVYIYILYIHMIKNLIKRFDLFINRISSAYRRLRRHQ
jgi:hypothetical protein